MPRHKQVTTCLRGGGSLSKFCSCEHCCLAVCAVCGAYEAGLTTDCPGEGVNYDRQREVYETALDYTDERGWHLGETMKHRAPRFEDTKLPPVPPRVDPRAAAAPSIDWGRVDRAASLQHDLALAAIAWVHADRACEDRSATLVRTESEADPLRGKAELEQCDRDLLARLERDRIDFRMADQRAQNCDDAFRQAARNLVAALEDGAPARTEEAQNVDDADASHDQRMGVLLTFR